MGAGTSKRARGEDLLTEKSSTTEGGDAGTGTSSSSTSRRQGRTSVIRALREENRELRERIRVLEDRLDTLSPRPL
jgi:hypothetical protein